MPMLLILAAPAAQVLQTTPLQAVPGTLLIDRNRIDRDAPPPLPLPSTPTAKPIIGGGETGAPIAGIRFAGSKAPARVAAAGRPFLGRPITRATLTLLANALSKAYANGRVALYTVAIPAQRFGEGVVIVSLTEGRIARGQISTDKSDAFPLLRRRIAPLTKGSPLARATFERQLTLIRAIPGLTVATEFADPNHDGALVMTATPKQRRSKLTAGFSNRGVALLGDGQFDLRGELYGIGTDGDQLTLTASAAPDFKRFRYLSAGYAAPVGTNGLTASVSGAYLETRPRGSAITGRAKQAGASLSFPLVRRFKQSVDVSLGLDGLDSDNAAFGNVIATERTRAVRLAGSVVDARARRQVTLAGSVSQGLDVLGAQVTTSFADATFTKAAVSASVAQSVGKRLSVRISASGQYSGDRLPAAERFAIGGATIGRAFDISLLTGDRGIGTLGELAWRPFKAAKFVTSEIYSFLDGGQVVVLARAPFIQQTYSLASAGFGLRARYRDKGELGLEAARVIDDPYPGYAEHWRFSVNWRISS